MTLQARPARLSTRDASFEADFKARLHWSAEADAAIEERVAAILADVQQRGDAAVLDYTQRFDGLTAASVQALELTQAELKAAFDGLPAAQRTALQAAAARVRSYHEAQKKASGESWSYRDEGGTLLGQKVTPLDRVGIYVPGGKAAYPSSVLMNAIPAHVAGVAEIIMVVPTPAKDRSAAGASHGEKNPLVLAAAYVAGVSRAFTIGGAQAVAALAYGADSVAKVDKIVGPGNAFVAEAKRLLFGQVGIDVVAGPTESLVIADASADADIVTADLIGQAEHGPDSPVWLITSSRALGEEVLARAPSVIAALPELARQAAEAAWRDHAEVVLVDCREEAVQVSDNYACEHVQVMARDLDWWLANLSNYGSLFLGEETTVAYGDKCSGPNHILPTRGAARYSGGLSVGKFIKTVTWQRLNREASRTVGQVAARISRLEGMEGHARTGDVRLAKYFPHESFDLGRLGGHPG